MNKRIRKLTEQAGFVLPNNIMNGVNGHGVVTEQEKLTKFAEMIVRECAGRVDWIFAEGGGTQGDLIREHFGVKL